MTSLPPGSVAVILPAAGSGSRFGEEENKLFASLGNRSLWMHAVEIFLRRTEVGMIVLAVSDRDRERFEREIRELSGSDRIRVVLGGDERSDTVAAALDEIDRESANTIEWVAVHDAARPLVRDTDLDDVFDAARQTNAAILATPVTGTLKREPAGNREDGARTGDAGLGHGTTFDRRGMWVAQTPQVFQLSLIRGAYDRHRGRRATDDAELVERMGHPVALVPGAADNLKITYPADLLLAEALLSERMKNPNCC
ncbi:2-C-methyl-D-erythritol 4-phosphate cytidylyltransferase [Rhodopirellula sallentina]|uniref:2-C-methyl-D-erythritol 4-phosphate cytidylyltransferase n=1 Tax=Rhodopirellula sallentina SM41 TaxID=1263870 RepID=M5U8M2_9BACT|nr:2-C-methyl-D-erythritol 4-phosphate cytidylyltransferase [Rhodopirellula sallentina]EMI57785.1 C-methyl-D-erythritol 4-phosphate cytidylyltransferase [Rhodopirellula sallentina SM41]